MFSRSLLCACVALLVPCVKAGTISVGPLGSGASFDSIQAAVIAAQPGDVILVAPGSYADFGAIVIDKELTVLGAGADVTSFRAQSTGFFDLPFSIVIENLAADEEVRVTGLDLNPSAVTPGFPALGNATSVRISDCQGPVLLSGVRSLGTGGLPIFKGTFAIENSANVSLMDCEAQPMDGTAAAQLGEPDGHMAIAGVWIGNSTVSLSDCRVTGGAGGTGGAQQGALDGGYGIAAHGSTLRVARSTIVGGLGGNGLLAPPEPGGVGVFGVGSDLFLRGGSGNAIRGGAGRAGFSGGLPAISFGAPALRADLQSFLTTTNDAALISGADGDGVVTVAVLDFSGLHTMYAEAHATLQVTPYRTIPGGQVVIGLESEANSIFATFFSVQQGSPIGIPGVLGIAHLDIGSFEQLPTVVANGTGQAQLNLVVPSDPTLIGISVVVQSLGVSPLGTLSVSNLAMLEVQ